MARIDSRAYRAWKHMKGRCNNPNYQFSDNYKGLDITYQDSWELFENFFADMGEAPEGTLLDRKNNNGHYTKENCRWATSSEQNHNRGMFRNNSTGIKGVTWLKNQRIYRARANYRGNTLELYSGSDFFEACCARKSWEASVLRTETVL